MEVPFDATYEGPYDDKFPYPANAGASPLYTPRRTFDVPKMPSARPRSRGRHSQRQWSTTRNGNSSTQQLELDTPEKPYARPRSRERHSQRQNPEARNGRFRDSPASSTQKMKFDIPKTSPARPRSLERHSRHRRSYSRERRSRFPNPEFHIDPYESSANSLASSDCHLRHEARRRRGASGKDREAERDNESARPRQEDTIHKAIQAQCETPQDYREVVQARRDLIRAQNDVRRMGNGGPEEQACLEATRRLHQIEQSHGCAVGSFSYDLHKVDAVLNRISSLFPDEE